MTLRPFIHIIGIHFWQYGHHGGAKNRFRRCLVCQREQVRDFGARWR